MGGIFWALIVSSMYFSDAEGNKVEFPDKRPWFGCCIQAYALVEHGLSRVRNISPAKRASRKLRSTSAMPFPCSNP